MKPYYDTDIFQCSKEKENYSKIIIKKLKDNNNIFIIKIRHVFYEKKRITLLVLFLC